MDKSLMHQNIRNTIQGNANAYIEFVVEAIHHTEHREKPGWNSEHQRKKVVALKLVPCWDVMILMDTPKETMHDILMRKPGHAFHKRE